MSQFKPDSLFKNAITISQDYSGKLKGLHNPNTIGLTADIVFRSSEKVNILIPAGGYINVSITEISKVDPSKTKSNALKIIGFL